MKIIYKYTGDGRHYSGLPAQDMTAEEVAALTTEQGALLLDGLNNGLYQKVPGIVPSGKPEKPAPPPAESVPPETVAE